MVLGLALTFVGVTTAASSAACDQVEPKPASDAIRVEGHERLQWDQTGPSLDVVKGYRYVAVVGRQPHDLKRVACAARPSGDAFVCSGELPPMGVGVHQVWVLAVATDDHRVLVSRWGPPLTLEKQ